MHPWLKWSAGSTRAPHVVHLLELTLGAGKLHQADRRGAARFLQPCTVGIGLAIGVLDVLGAEQDLLLNSFAQDTISEVTGCINHRSPHQVDQTSSVGANLD